MQPYGNIAMVASWPVSRFSLLIVVVLEWARQCAMIGPLKLSGFACCDVVERSVVLAEVADCPSGIDGGAGLEQDVSCTAKAIAAVAWIAPAIRSLLAAPAGGDFD